MNVSRLPLGYVGELFCVVRVWVCVLCVYVGVGKCFVCMCMSLCADIHTRVGGGGLVLDEWAYIQCRWGDLEYKG